MSSEKDDFLTWATDPSRTVEELFGVELLVEQCMPLWNRKHGVQVSFDWEAIRLARKNRQLDPRYKPSLARRRLEQAAEVLDQLTSFSTHVGDDRHLRDISFLRFCEKLDSLRLYHCEITDWSPLASRPQLLHLYVSDDVARDLRAVGELVQLKTLTLRLATPWPRLDGLENLTRLTEFMFYGNVLAVNAIRALPGVRAAEFHHGSGFNVPLRSVADLPDMPELRRLRLENTDLLDGIGRFPHLLNLEIYGYLPDLAPLAGNVELTHLYLSGIQFADLNPLTSLTQLCRITLRNDFPPDLTPLAELPRLHQIVVQSEAIVPPELDSLNALCAPWDEEFACDPPRKLDPLRLVVEKNRKKDHDAEADFGGMPRDHGDDREMVISETNWFIRQANHRIDRVLGKGWGAERETISGVHQCGHLYLRIRRRQDLDHLPAVVRTLRQLIASCRYPWQLDLLVEPLADYERDLDEIEDDYDSEETFDPEREREEWEYRRRRQLERREYLQRRYQARLGEELGIEPVPEPGSAAAPPPEKALAEGDDSGPGYDLGTDLHLYFTLTEKCAIVAECDRGLAEMLLEIKAEE
ncbi:leucine-rich repeat domain-containing protein [Haloferula sargassicola]|uniref:Leucine-rich repeat domain-containing protein n=1 Tax=Haloferula sargassicola TaxID=490096 RepID=A0ABP9UX01_9BACT